HDAVFSGSNHTWLIPSTPSTAALMPQAVNGLPIQHKANFSGGTVVGIESGIVDVGPFSPFPMRTQMRLTLLAAGTPTATSPPGLTPQAPPARDARHRCPSRGVSTPHPKLPTDNQRPCNKLQLFVSSRYLFHDDDEIPISKPHPNLPRAAMAPSRSAIPPTAAPKSEIADRTQF